jgi:hypothetical protein
MKHLLKRWSRSNRDTHAALKRAAQARQRILTGGAS